MSFKVYKSECMKPFGREDRIRTLRPPRPERGALPAALLPEFSETAKVAFFIMTANTALSITLHGKLYHDL